MLLLVLLECRAECNPEHHVLNNATLSSDDLMYCGAPSIPADGGLYSWTWVVGGCKHLTVTGCDCHSYGNGAQCMCRSEFKQATEMCYNAELKCPFCAPGQYTVGCGCGDCTILPKITSAYDASNPDAQTSESIPSDNEYSVPPYAMLGNCADAGYHTGFVCGPGTCSQCPKGHYCNDGHTLKPCAEGFYQDQEGQLACKKCTVPTYGQCLKNGIPVANSCDPVKGWEDLFMFCDRCTQTSDENGNPRVFDFATCACEPFDPTYGRNTANDCVPCMQCSGKLYAQPPIVNNSSCVTDLSQCQLMYNADLNAQADKCWQESGTVGLSCTTVSSENIKMGAMPWLSGYIRTQPPDTWRYMPGDQYMPGLLPFYKPCPSSYILNDRYVARLSAQNHLNDQDWIFDCDPYTTRECAKQYVAVLENPSVAIGDGSVLIECIPCQGQGFSPGGLVQHCQCPAGYGNWWYMDNMKNLGPIMPVDGTTSEACVNCFTDVVFKHADGNIYQEAVACRGSVVDLPVQRCNTAWDLYVDASAVTVCSSCSTNLPTPTAPCAGGVYTAHEPIAIPLPNRKGCHICPAGTRIDEAVHDESLYSCVACEDGTYQPLTGQCGCLAKRTFCEQGQQLKLNAVPTLIDDTPCEPCAQNCTAPGDLTIFALDMGNTTCNGHGLDKFACFHDVFHDGFAPETYVGRRLAYPSANTLADEQPHEALIEVCDPNLLPKGTDQTVVAQFVGHQRGHVVGIECYFACQYGVNGPIAASYTKAIRAYIYAYKPTLVPFLVTEQSPVSAWGKPPSVQSIRVPVTWLLGNTDAPMDASALEWTVSELWDVVSNNDTVDVSQNTFLFDADFLSLNLSAWDGLCQTPPQAYTWPCPWGIVSDISGAPTMCALDARLHTVRVNSSAGDEALAILRPSTQSNAQSAGIECMAPVGASMTGYSAGCTTSCLDTRLRTLKRLTASLMPDMRPWYMRMAWTLTCMMPSFWQTYFRNFHPYQLPYVQPPRYSATTNNYTATSVPFSLVADEQACHIQCAAGTFRYDPSTAHTADGVIQFPSDGLPACIPCDFPISSQQPNISIGKSLCYLFDPPRYFMNAICLRGPSQGQKELTYEDVCSKCPPTVPNGTLIDPTTADYDNWRQVRTMYNALAWDTNVKCRYRCDPTFSSNTEAASDVFNTYNQQPCVPCSSLRCQVDPLIASYVSSTASMATCGQGPNYAPFHQECDHCDNSKYQSIAGNSVLQFIFNVGGTNPVDSDGLCLAVCNPAYYQTFRSDPKTNTWIFTTDYTPVKLLKCVRCNQGDPTHGCNGHCGEDQYSNLTVTSELQCVACNTTRCESPNTYREKCFSGKATRDAQCVACPRAMLLNDPSGMQGESPLVVAARSTTRLQTRRWLTQAELAASPYAPYVVGVRSPHPDQCAVACINNYAWVNLTSGLSPSAMLGSAAWSNAPEMACLPCGVLSTLEDRSANPNLYSIWNRNDTTYASPAAWNPVLNSMSALPGACYECLGVRDVVASSTQLCELLPGYSEDAQGVGAWAYLTLRVPSASTLQMSADESLFMNETVLTPFPKLTVTKSDATPPGGRRRALLQASNNNNIQDVTASLSTGLFSTNEAYPLVMRTQILPAHRPPILTSGAYYACCDDPAYTLDPMQRTQCRAMQGNLRSQSACPSIPRRSLSAWFVNGTGMPPAESCPVGTFKDVRGAAPCSICSVGASTDGVAGVDAGGCICQPGYYSVSAAQGYCQPCPDGTYRGPLDPLDQCIPCHPLEYTRTGLAATECTCRPGLYKSNPSLSTLPCLPCEAHHYCSAGVRQPCPSHGLSPPRSEAQSDCVCDPSGYYGDLSLPDGACYPRTPGITVHGTCAVGWTIRSSASASDIWIQCLSPCGAGTYTLVEPSTQAVVACVPCPMDTYAVDGSLVDACTPCPQNRGTAGREGQTSSAGCTCILLGNATDECGGCDAGFYFDVGYRHCVACPSGWTAPANTIGPSGCRCPMGHFASGAQCEPCPMGTYSHALSLTCTPCPKGCTTNAVGQTTIAACYCVLPP